LLASLMTGGEVGGERWVGWVGLMLLRPWSDASSSNCCSMKKFDMMNCASINRMRCVQRVWWGRW
jgi:hypothetical protein